MNKFIKFLKIILLIISILIGFSILVGVFFVYKGVKSGDLESYVTKAAIENLDKLVPEAVLTPELEAIIETGDYEEIAQEIEENITPEQVDCAIEILGPQRAQELMITKDPTPQEILKLSKCL